MTTNPSVYTDLQGLTALRSQAHRDPEKKLREAASQFEALFIQNMLKSARAASLAPGALDGPHSDTYQQMYDQQLALTLAKGKGIGIAEMLVHQLQNTLPGSSDHTTAPAANAIKTTSMGSNRATISSFSPSPSRVSVTPTLPPTPSKEITASQASSPTSQTAQKIRTPEEFVASVWPAACDAAEELGVDPEVLVAQAAVESGWGRSVAHLPDGRSSHNLFGIKADSRWSGSRTIVSTLEYQDGIAVRRQDPFRAYNSFTDSFSDYAHFLRSNPRYQDALDQADDPEAFLHGLQAAGYATDPAYARKVASVLHGDTLRSALANLDDGA
ncbi:flagellar protein FlgJ [Gammaproteobacteria bacterium]